MTIQPDGRIIAAGNAGYSFPRFALARYRPNGRLDRSFGNGGKVSTPFHGVDSAWPTGVALLPDGRIVMAGESYSGSILVARYGRAGRLDRRFSGNGWVETTLGVRVFLSGNALCVDADGRTTVVGARARRSTSQFLFVRYGRGGRLDPSSAT